MQTLESSKTIEDMKKRIDRLMKAVYNEIEDGDFRIELVSRLIGVRELLDERREEPSN
ncbi:hypothetical protein LCGC14_1340340 [marine sediment metagenome]|uniref:Uncharacterized protein n=1 Tax=marine sediment metagenome TaxID=412755 RepID=A0A0F9KEN0_9ZZZZ